MSLPVSDTTVTVQPTCDPVLQAASTIDVIVVSGIANLVTPAPGHSGLRLRAAIMQASGLLKLSNLIKGAVETKAAASEALDVFKVSTMVTDVGTVAILGACGAINLVIRRLCRTLDDQLTSLDDVIFDESHDAVFGDTINASQIYSGIFNATQALKIAVRTAGKEIAGDTTKTTISTAMVSIFEAAVQEAISTFGSAILEAVKH